MKPLLGTGNPEVRAYLQRALAQIAEMQGHLEQARRDTAALDAHFQNEFKARMEAANIDANA